MAAAGALRPQPGRDRRRLRGARDGLHRRRGEGEGDAGRAPPDGRRLPQHRLRAVQGADPHREAACRTMRRAKEFGIRAAAARVRLRRGDGARAARGEGRSSRTIRSSATRAWASKCLQGTARITSPWTVEVAAGRRRRSGRSPRSNIVIAAGARPFVPPIPGLTEADPLTSDTVWDLRELPRRLVVLGGGPIGCELAQCFARLGSKVTQVEMLPRIMIREDPGVLGDGRAALREDGIDVLVGPQGEGGAGRERREGRGGRARGRGEAHRVATRSSAPSAASPTPRATASRSSASRSRSRRRSR